MSERISERVGIVATIDPDAYTAATYLTDAIDMALIDRVAFVVMAGDLGSSATLDFKVVADTASGGSYATDITGKAITQLTQAGTDSDKQVIVEVTGDEVIAQGMRYIKGSMTVAVATSDCGVIALASSLRFQPAKYFDLASVDEIVA